MSERPAGPVVSPADTPAALRAYAAQLPTVLSVGNLRTKLREAADEMAALLAVGERDKAEIIEMRERHVDQIRALDKLRLRDRRQIARAEERIEQLTKALRGIEEWTSCRDARSVARAVLAGEEDAGDA